MTPKTRAKVARHRRSGDGWLAVYADVTAVNILARPYVAVPYWTQETVQRQPCRVTWNVAECFKG